MKKTLILFLILLVIISTAQNKPAPVNFQKGKGKVATIQNQLTYLDHDTCIDKQFSVVFYVVLDSLYSALPASQPTLDLMVAKMNEVFKPICVSFVTCRTVHIPNFTYNRWRKATIEPVVTANYYTEKTINVYIVDSVQAPPLGFPANPDAGALGYSYGPSIVPNAPAVPTRSDVIVLEKSYLINPNYWALFHHLGHFFGLPHTFEEIGVNTGTVTPPPNPAVLSYEFVDGSNCMDHGDGFCDTDPDNNSITILTDGKGDFYAPPIDNFMSHHLTGCRYTAQQLSFMARMIARRRLYLH